MSEPVSLVLAAVVVVLPALPLLLTLLNLRSWRRPDPAFCLDSQEGEVGMVSVLIPARNEAERIGGALASALRQGEIVREVVVYSDASTDATDDLVRQVAQRDARVRLVRGEGPPAGWVGKPHACQRLLEEAQGELLLFLDADVRLLPGAVLGLCRELPATKWERSLVTGVPLQLMETFFEKLILPLLHVTYMAWLPLRWAERSKDPRMVAANGQLMMLSRSSAQMLGGFAGVAAEIVDDVALARLARTRGLSVLFVDASRLAVCRMYESASGVWRGFAKNLYEGLGSPMALLIALGLNLGCFVVPYLGLLWAFLALSVESPRTLLLSASALGVLANLVLRILLAKRYGHAMWAVLAHPLAVMVLCVQAMWSSWLSFRGGIEWAGRRYATRSKRVVNPGEALP